MTASPVLVVVAAMVLMMTSWLVSGRPRQFRVIWENSRCSILFHLEVPGGKWQQVTSRPVSRARSASAGLPGPVPPPVGPPGVAADQQPPRGRVGVPARQVPPAADGLHRQRGGVVVGAHVHEPGVRPDVVDPVRDRVPALLIVEAVITDLHRAARRPPLPPGLRILPDLLLLLGIHADHRLARGQVLPRLRGDIPELGIAVRMPPPLGHLRVGLGGKPLPAQQPPDRLRAAPVPGRGQLTRELLHALGRPQQRRSRIPPGGILHQVQQRRHQPGISPGQRLARARPADPAFRRDLPGLQLRRPIRDRLPRRPGHLGHRADPAVPGRPRHHPQRQPPGLLIQHRQQQLQLRPDTPQELRARAHTSILARDTPETRLITECLRGCPDPPRKPDPP